jgi:hypothetical protein
MVTLNEADFDTTQKCSLFSRISGDDSIGQARSYLYPMFLEAPAPWVFNFVESDHIPAGVTDDINLAILPAGDREEGIDHFGFQVEDFEATARTAMAAGASEAPKEVPQDGRFAEGFIRDPVGTRIDLSQRGWLTKSAD